MQYSDFNPKIAFPKEGTQRFQILQQIDREDLCNYYKSHTLVESAKYFDVSENALSWLIKFYGIKKTREEKHVSLLNKYGNDLDLFYKENYEKRNKKYIEKYGSIEAFYEYRKNKSLKTVEQKYGSYESYLKYRNARHHSIIKEKYDVDNISQISEIKEKKKQSLIKHYGSIDSAYKIRQQKTDKTLIEKYGSVENYRQYQQEKARKTYERNYGVKSPFAAKEIQQKIKDTVKKRYGVEYSCMINSCVTHHHNSKPNLQLEEIFIAYGINIDSKEFCLGNFIYDFKVDNYLIEVNPFPTHNINWSPFGKKLGLKEDYHQCKSMNAFKNNYRCIHIWDWTDITNVLENIKSKKYIIENQKFGPCRKFVYDYKLNQLVDEESETTVIIFDDGILLDEGEL